MTITRRRAGSRTRIKEDRREHRRRCLGLVLLLAAPLGVLLLILARERTVRIGQAQERLEAVRRERVRLQRAIQRIGEAFAPTLDFDDLLELTLQASAEAIDADGGRTSVLHAGRLGVIPHATVGAHETLPAALDAAEGQVLLNGQPAERREGDVTALAWPIGGHDNDPERRAGIVALARCGEPFNPFERSLLDYFVKQANVSVDNIDLRETLRLQAGTDSLTGLANRRRFEDVLAASVVHYDAARGWLHTIATNAARRSLRPSGEVAITGEEDWVATTTADGELLERSEREQVHEGLRRALGEHARFLRWRYVEDLSPTAIMELRA